MKKSLIALAVAGAFAAPAFAATSNVDVYGTVRVAIESMETDDGNDNNDDMQVVDRVSRIGFKGSEDLGGGLKAIWQIESALSATGGPMGGATLAGRNTFVGLSGGFGTALMGRHDTPYKLGTGKLDLFADTAADYNTGGINLATATGIAGGTAALGYVNSVHDHRSPQAIAYISPTFSGFHGAIALVATDTAANLDDGDSEIDAVSATGIYENGPLFASLSYQTVEEADAAMGVAAGTLDGSDAWKLGVGYSFGDFKVGAIYENVKVDITAGGDEIEHTSWMLNGAYAMGPITFKAAYGNSELDTGGVGNGTGESDLWAVGVDYALSKRTNAYVLYKNDDVDNGFGNDVDGFAIGMNHSF